MTFAQSLLFILVIVFNCPAQAQNRGLPLVVKSNFPGYVMPDYSFTETCSLYNDRVEITYGLENNKITESRSIKNGKVLETLISKAAQEKLRFEDNLLCDGPSTVVYAHKRNSVEKISLYSTGGCGTPKEIREGGAAFQIMRLMESYCAKTY